MKTDIYRYAEKCLYQYEYNQKELLESIRELEYLEGHGDVRVQGYRDWHNSVGTPEDGVNDYVHCKDELERRIERLMQEVSVVQEVIGRLEQQQDDHAMKLLAVQHCYYEMGDIGGLMNMQDLTVGELKALRHELVRLVCHEVRKSVTRH